MATILQFDQIPRFDRGSEIWSVPLATGESTRDANEFVTGISSYPVGQGARFHCHNCDEQVVVLSGAGKVEVDGIVKMLGRYDGAYIEAGLFHSYRKASDTEPMVILWIYGSKVVTRTFADTGETVDHLSASDLMGSTD